MVTMKAGVRVLGALLAAAVFATVPVTAGAVEEWLWGASYQVSFAQGNTSDFISKTSWRGLGLDGRRFVDEWTSVGLAISWNVFHDRAYRTSPIEDGAVSGTQFRDINALPILVTAHRYFGDRYGWRPFVGGGVGVMYMDQRVDIGLFRLSQDHWAFALAPEVGIQFPYDRFLGYLAARWNYSAPTSTLPYQSYATILVGFGLR
jgi:hypothetical protein